MKKILVIEDQQHIRETVIDYLTEAGYDAYQARDGLVGLSQFHEIHPDLVVLDVMLPFKEGWAVLKEIRLVSQVPVVMLTAKTREGDILQGFELEASDYVTKPFSPKVLMARIKRLLNNQKSSGYHLGDLNVDFEKRIVAINQKSIPFTRLEFDVLALLIKNPDQVFSRTRLLDAVWGMDYEGSDRAVDACIKKVRKKLVTMGVCIQSVFGIGYKWSEDYGHKE